MRNTRLLSPAALLAVLLLPSCGSDSAKTEAPAPAGNRPVIAQEEYTPSSTPTTPPASTTPPSTPDASVPDSAPKVPTTAKQCFKDLEGAIVGPDYDKYSPKMSKNCSGTKHQNITGIEKLVFLGDSVTTGTPPTLPWEYYSARVEAAVKQKFGNNIEAQNCSKWGARVDDFLDGGRQIEKCFPTGVEQKNTLIVMTMGGNDISSWMNDKLDATAAMTAANEAVQMMSDALHWLKDPAHFPNGSSVVFANVYEYTDTSGELTSCPQAQVLGVNGKWLDGAAAIVHLQEEYLRLAVETNSDMIFLLESFCGHGYKRNDPSLQCYRGPNAELWFDLTCIHPTPKGHEVIANLFKDVIL